MPSDPYFRIGQRVVLDQPGHTRHGQQGAVVDIATFSHPTFTSHSYYIRFDESGEQELVNGDELRTQG
jgi:hypothetical protein